MATYAIPPQKGMADVLNEAADANERGMESTRRSALTMSQLQGEQQRQRFAEAEAGRAEKRFGFESENQDFLRRQRKREEDMVTDIEGATQKYLFREVEEPNPNATPGSIPGRQVAFVDAQSGQTTPPPPATIKRRVPVDLATPEGLRGIADFQVAVFQARAKAGKVDQNEMNQLITFGSMLEQRGNRDLFRQALSGDQKATASLASKLGMDPNNLTIVGGVDEDKNSKSYGFPNIFAVRRTTDGNGKETVVRTPIGHLAAMYAPEVYDATIGKPLAAMKDQSTITYQGKAGDAAVTSANAAASNARSAAGLRTAQTNLANAQAGVLAETGGRVPNNPATDALRFSSNFSERGASQPFKSPAMEMGYNMIAGWVGQQPGMGQMSTRNFMDSEWAKIRASLPGQMQVQLSTEPQYLKSDGKTRMTIDDLGIDEKRQLEANAIATLSQRYAAQLRDPNSAVGQGFIAYQNQVASRRSAAMGARTDSRSED